MAVEPTEPQAEVLERLADPDVYPDRPPRVDRIDTHTAHVFQAGDRAYKVKREVRYSFLDYSTLERRRLACEAEVRLNRRTAPALYLGVTPVTRDPSGRLGIGGPGPAIVSLTPQAHEQRGSQLNLRHPEAYAVMQALIAKGIIGDFRQPDIMRFGFAPLYLSYAEVETAAMTFCQVIAGGEWDRPEFKQRAKVV